MPNKKKKIDSKLGWHFLPKDMKLGYGDGRKAEVGKTLSITKADGKPDTCNVGMHASERIMDAANHKKGPVLCRVEVSGDLDLTDSKKFAGRSRRVLWAKELTAKDIKEALSFAGTPSSYNGIDDLVDALGARNYEPYSSKLEKWLGDWAKKNGCTDKGAGVPVEIIEVTPKVTEAQLKAYLAGGVVRTVKDIKAAFKGFDLTPSDAYYDSVIDELVDNLTGDEIIRVDDYYRDSNGCYQEGYVLQRRSR